MPGAICTGSCNRDGEVTINELLAMVNIALGNATFSDCGAGDGNHDGTITVNEIIQGLASELSSAFLAS